MEHSRRIRKISIIVLTPLVAFLLFGCDASKGGAPAATDVASVSVIQQDAQLLEGTPAGDLTWKSPLVYPVSIDQGADGRYYVADHKTNSVLILDAELNPVGELKDLFRPVSVAVDSVGNIFVGSKGKQAVLVYNNQGGLIRVIDSPVMQIPCDIVFDAAGAFYVADAASKVVHKFNPNGSLANTIKFDQASWPQNLAISPSGELFVVDSTLDKIHVVDAEGNIVRSFGEKLDAFADDWEGKFVHPMSINFDSQGTLQVYDSYLNKIQAFNPETGAFISVTADVSVDGTLRFVPDFLITDDGFVITDKSHSSVEFIETARN